MGFITGLTGGITLTLGLAYLTSRAHQNARETQSAVLRAQVAMLNDLVVPDSSRSQPRRQPSRAQTEAQYQANLMLSAKDRWNREVESAAKWVQQTDWDEVREKAEYAAAQAWERVVGYISSRNISSRKAVKEAKEDARQMLDKEEESAGWLWAAAKERGAEAGKKAESQIAKSVEKGKEEEGRGWLGRARATVVGQTEKSEVTGETGETGETAVQKALRERYSATTKAGG